MLRYAREKSLQGGYRGSRGARTRGKPATQGIESRHEPVPLGSVARARR